MKKLFVTLAVAAAAITQASAAMSLESIRENARFLTDRMAYELELTPEQIEDCYEINYDFIASINPIMDDVVYGNTVMTDHYYDFLNYRNEDLRYIMNRGQYLRFMALDYFYRPVYTYGSRWLFSIYNRYNNPYYYYYSAPRIYHSYVGAHARHYHPHGYYGGSRYRHVIYDRPFRLNRGGGHAHVRNNSYAHRGSTHHYSGSHHNSGSHHAGGSHHNSGSHRSGSSHHNGNSHHSGGSHNNSSHHSGGSHHGGRGH